VIVALDPDARNKTVKIVKELRTVVERVYGLNLKDDLKYMRSEDIESLLERINDSL
jgi:transcriptional regulatory protein LevR